MDFYARKNLWKLILFLVAVLIGAVTLLYTESFLKDLRNEEVKKADLWAKAMYTIQDADPDADITLPTQIIRSNNTIPVILTDANDSIIAHKNFSESRTRRKNWLKTELEEMKAAGNVIEVSLGNDQRNYVYYQNSNLLRQLRLYPIVLLIVISIFVLIAYIAFSSARRSEQNQVWNGLAKETAHQIGTPLSSLMGWLEMLKAKGVEREVATEMEKDINRLDTITDRFSKIGSEPSRQPVNLSEATHDAVSYLKSRSPKKIEIQCHAPDQPLMAEVNLPLYEWVIENLVRNAIDAISGQGEISVNVTDAGKNLHVEVSDSGKGIPANKHKKIFRPGYSTKKRGWGLGLSLARRIIEEYHHGRIYVAHSHPSSGTTFRIVLDKADA